MSLQVHDDILIKIVSLETAKKTYNNLKEFKGKDRTKEFQGNDRTKRMLVLNLRREFEPIRMKDNESIK